MRDLTVREWQRQFNNGEFDASDKGTQCQAGWYDWFCRDSSLANKTKKLGGIVARITNVKILDGMYVWFKNNCPCTFPLYDDFRFADIANGCTIYTIEIDSKRNTFKYVVWGRENDFKEALFETSSVRKLVDWFNYNL